MTVARQSRLVRALRVVPSVNDDERSDALSTRTNNVRAGPSAQVRLNLGAGLSVRSLERKSRGVMKNALAGGFHETTMQVTQGSCAFSAHGLQHYCLLEVLSEVLFGGFQGG